MAHAKAFSDYYIWTTRWQIRLDASVEIKSSPHPEPQSSGYSQSPYGVVCIVVVMASWLVVNRFYTCLYFSSHVVSINRQNHATCTFDESQPHDIDTNGILSGILSRARNAQFPHFSTAFPPSCKSFVHNSEPYTLFSLIQR